LEKYPQRGPVIPESKISRHLLFGKKPNTYRIIYAVDKRKSAVNVLRIRHSARAPLSNE
jgi:toxin ParE1/3/4